MIKMVIVLFYFTFILSQNNFNKEFDFWIGDWETESTNVQDSWKTVTKGNDRVKYLLKGRLIEEVFKKSDNLNFQRGYLTYSYRDKKWLHTIYDVKWGNYSFEGSYKDGEMILVSNDTRPGKRREVFKNIKKNSFEYLWESSRDGKNWQTVWKVKYRRK